MKEGEPRKRSSVAMEKQKVPGNRACLLYKSGAAMSETFGLEIYASNKLAYAGRAQKLIIPAVDGEQGFLAHHANVVAAIIPGEMRFEDADGNEYVFAVSSGFVEMINNRAKLFCLSVELSLIHI